jgi:hypothetical protein
MIRTSTLTLLTLSLVACGTPAVPPAEEAQPAGAATAAAGPRIYRPASVDVLVRTQDPNLARSLDAKLRAQMQARLDAHRAAFAYQPSTAPKPDPGAPRTGSFIEDSWTLHQRLSGALRTSYAPACTFDPCVLTLDLDGQGGRDSVVSAWERSSKAFTFAVETNRATLIGHQQKIDLRGTRQWSVIAAGEIRAPGFTRDGVLITSGTPQVRHLLYHDSAALRLIKL